MEICRMSETTCLHHFAWIAEGAMAVGDGPSGKQRIMDAPVVTTIRNPERKVWNSG